MLSDDITAEECFRRLSGVGGGAAGKEGCGGLTYKRCFLSAA